PGARIRSTRPCTRANRTERKGDAMSGARHRRKGNRVEAGAAVNRQLDMFVAEPAAPLIGLRIKVDRPGDRDQPCCRNNCIGPGKAPYAGELICADCGQHRGWLSKTTAHCITKPRSLSSR